MKIVQLRYLLNVAGTLSVERTAAEFGLSAQAVRAQLQSLEKEIGAALLARGPAGLRLTHVGEAVLEEAHHVVAEWRRFTELAEATTAPLQLRVGIAGSTIYSGIGELIRVFRQRRPEVDVSVVQRPMRDLVAALSSRDIDVAFLRTGVVHPDFETTILGAEALLAAVPATHPLAAKQSIRLVQLSEEPFIGFVGPFNRSIHDYISEGCLAGGFVPAIETRTDDIQSLLGLVASGMGVSLVPEGLVKAVTMPGVRYLPLQAPTPRAEFCALSRGDDPPSSLARQLTALAEGAFLTRRSQAEGDQ